jgi:VCBS repeat-containing protein
MANDGTVTWDYTTNEGHLDFLGEGETVTATFTVTVTDDGGATDTQDVTINITGTNDAPVISPAAGTDIAGSVQEDEIVAAIGEAGTILASQTGSNDWMQVTFAVGIPDAVVAMMLNTKNGGNPAMMRVRDVTDTGFEYQLDEYDSGDGAHTEELFSWIAVSAGDHVLTDGTVIKAGYTSANTSAPSEVVFNSDFTNAPVVLTQVSTVNEADAVTTRNIVTSEGFHVSLQEENGTTAHGAEQVGWIAIDQATGTSIETGLTGDNVNQSETDIVFTLTFPDSLAFLAQMQTLDGADTATIRGTTLSATGASVFVEESPFFDENHTNENVGYVALPVGHIQGELTDSGFIEFTDVDLTDTHTVAVQNGGEDYLGSLAATIVDDPTEVQHGNVVWNFTVDNDDIDYLETNEQVEQTYTVTVADGKGGTDSQTVTITLNGTDEDQVIIIVTCSTAVLAMTS